MPRHELTFEEWHRVPGKDAYAVFLGWSRDREPLGGVQAALSGLVLRTWRSSHGDVERLKEALAMWMVDALRAEVEAGQGRTEWEEELHHIAVDVAAVERLASSEAELPSLVEGKSVGSFDEPDQDGAERNNRR